MYRTFHYLALFLFITILSNAIAQKNETITQEFTTKNGFNGQVKIDVTYKLENRFKILLELKEIQIFGFQTSIGSFSGDDLAKQGINFPVHCNDCSFNLGGDAKAEFTQEPFSASLPFDTQNPLNYNSNIILGIPFTVPIDEEKYQRAKNDWNTTASVINLAISNIKGTILRNIIDAVKKQNKIRVDSEHLVTLISQLKALPQEEQLQKVYASRNKFYNKKLPDSILLQVKKSTYNTLENRERKTAAITTTAVNNSANNAENITHELENKANQVAQTCLQQIEALEREKITAVKNEDYLLAQQLKNALEAQRAICKQGNSSEKINDSAFTTTSLDVPAEEFINTTDESLKKEDSLNELIIDINDNTDDQNKTLEHNDLSELTDNSKTSSLHTILSQESDSNQNILNSLTTNSQVQEDPKKVKKLSKIDFEFSSDIKKYKRSSLHSIMIRNPGAEQAEVIEKTFLDRPLPEKFNPHFVKTNFINVSRKARKQDKVITDFLNRNEIARDLVAKWFNRNEKGEFNMDLVAERGHYNASVFDVNIAKKSKRGLVLLEDAGENLIANTFVIVNDYKYTNKEEIAKKTGFLSSLVSTVANYAGAGDVALVADAVTVGTAVAGKGYVVKVTSYLYRLVWNEKIANRFYNELWVDASNFDAQKKAAFDQTDIFELKLVGYETDWSAVQSSAFTNKSDKELIQRATIKATDQTIARLQRKFEIFRTKTPLISTYPLAAKIGLKEGIEKGDKFEVLEQYLRDDGTTAVKKVGVIKVDKNQIWDNRFAASQENSSKMEYTTFSGSKNKYYQGMLIRQIN